MASPTQAGIFAFEADRQRTGLTASVGFLAIAGVLNSLIAAFLFLRLPPSQSPSLAALLLRSSLYVGVSVLAGMAGVSFYWKRHSAPFNSDPPLSFTLFALTNAAGWVWVPSVVFLSRQDSFATTLLASFGAAILATGLRRVLPPTIGLFQLRPLAPESEEYELFAQSLRTVHREGHGYVIAIGIYTAAFALQDGWILTSSAIFGVCAFVVALKLTIVPDVAMVETDRCARAALRLARIALAAVLVTTLVLFVGVARRNQADGAFAIGNRGSQGGDSDHEPKTSAKGAAPGISGYESIILWPVPEKKEIIPPLLPKTSSQSVRAAKLLVIPFSGTYWFFQPPDKRPGPQAHTAHGNPMDVDIRANNFMPLIMEAHQNLGTAVRVARCREILVTVDNRDNRPGAVALGVILTDSVSREKQELYLGQQPVVSSEPGRISRKSSPTIEVLRFPIPARARIHKYDAITVIFLPDSGRAELGAKIAIQEFELLPR
jgi:hypothetical protein